MLREVNDSTIDKEVYGSPKPVLLTFYASDCWICKLFRPDLEMLAEALEGRVEVLLINAGESPVSSRYHEIKSTPTYILFRDGQEFATLSGGQPYEDLLFFVNEYLSVDP
jgi:thioredoxin-like negative regulator of GroEL